MTGKPSRRSTMYLKPTREAPTQVALNLWAYVSEGRTILRLAGKVYILNGPRAENLALLYQLSRKDFLAAPWHEVPSKVMKIVADDPRAGPLVPMIMLRDRVSHSALFGPLIKHLAKTIPMQVRTENGKPRRFRMEFPKRLLTHSTIILEKQDGRQSALLPFD